jgi:hypothetical protein
LTDLPVQIDRTMGLQSVTGTTGFPEMKKGGNDRFVGKRSFVPVPVNGGNAP